ncbi:MAG: hypothetical protein ACE5LL_04360 [Alphaproteobacteria bacterium]
MAEIKAVLGRLESRVSEIAETVAKMLGILDGALPHLATKAELAETKAVLTADLADTKAVLKADLADTNAVLKADLADTKAVLRAELAETKAALKAELADKPSKAYMWMVVGVLVAAIFAAVALGAAVT